jgi:5-hydroxyisourate hydrolase-like protein (transthyretin family)
MSLFDYHRSQQLAVKDEPFYALIMAALRKADTDNYYKLAMAFPPLLS